MHAGELERAHRGFLLSNSDVSNGFANRAEVFARFGNGAGWKPQP